MFQNNFRVIVGLFLFFAFFIISAYAYDPDLGWHIQAGNYIVHHGIPAHDIFSYTAPHFEWINHEWLYSVVIYVLNTYGGDTLVALALATVWTSAVMLASRKSEPLILIAGAVSIFSFAGVRPSAFALIFFVLLELILDAVQHEHRTKKVWLLLPLLFLLWANMHGSFPLGFFVLVLFAFIHKKIIPWYIIATCIAVTFVNPYGYHIYTEIFRTLSSNELMRYVAEWKRFTIPVFYFFTIIPLLGIFFAVQKNLIQKRYILPLVLLLASILNTRFFLFFTASILRFLEEPWISLRAHISQKFSHTYLKFVYAGLLCGLLFIGLSIRVSQHVYYPVEAVAYLQENACSGNLFNLYDYGGYLIWKLPNQKVFIDGRMPTWRMGNENYMRDYINVITDPDFRKNIFKKHSISCVLFSQKAKPFIESLQKEGWITTVADNESILLVKPQSIEKQ